MTPIALSGCDVEYIPVFAELLCKTVAMQMLSDGLIFEIW
jgi:hypothetical protein